jgi:hypothetical protein
MAISKYNIGDKVNYRGTDCFKIIAIHNIPGRRLYYVIALGGDMPYVVKEEQIKPVVKTVELFGRIMDPLNNIIFGQSKLSQDNVKITAKIISGVLDMDSLEITKLGDKT